MILEKEKHSLNDNVHQYNVGNAPHKIMVIISDYSLEINSISGFIKVKSHETSLCPHCNGRLKACGSRKRGLKKTDGSNSKYIIRRLQCNTCKMIHHELPDVMVPYRRYESDAIENVLSVESIGDATYFPGEEKTARRIRLWFYLLKDYIEGSIQGISALYGVDITLCVPLFPLKGQPAGWLKVIVRSLVNSGRWPQTRFV